MGTHVGLRKIRRFLSRSIMPTASVRIAWIWIEFRPTILWIVNLRIYFPIVIIQGRWSQWMGPGNQSLPFFHNNVLRISQVFQWIFIILMFIKKNFFFFRTAIDSNSEIGSETDWKWHDFGGISASIDRPNQRTDSVKKLK